MTTQRRPETAQGVEVKGMAKISIGRIVHYRLSEDDLKTNMLPPYRGNPHEVGQEVPLIVARVWPDEFGPGPGVPGVNGQVIVDGQGTLWVTSRPEGTEPGTWHWPERV